MMEKVLNSVQEMQTFAKNLAKKIPGGTIIALIGNLGSGKTTFSQGFARGLGIQDSVISPTFKLVSEYEGTHYPLYHIDCYRLDSPEDFLNIGGENYLNPENGITIIEILFIFAFGCSTEKHFFCSIKEKHIKNVSAWNNV